MWAQVLTTVGTAIVTNLGIEGAKRFWSFADDAHLYWSAEDSVEYYDQYILDAFDGSDEGILFEIEVVRIEYDGGTDLVMAPVPIGRGTSPDEAATQFLIGAPNLPDDLSSMVSTYLDNAAEIEEAIGSKAELSQRTFRIWVEKDENGALIFSREEPDSNFLSGAVRRAKILKIRKAHVKNLPFFESLAEQSIQYSEIVEQYRSKAIEDGNYAAMLALQVAREEASGSVRDVADALDRAERLQGSLKIIQAFQTALSVASFAINKHQSDIANAKLEELNDKLDTGFASLDERLTILGSEIQDIQNNLDQLREQLVNANQELREFLIESFGTDDSVLPDIDVPGPY